VSEVLPWALRIILKYKLVFKEPIVIFPLKKGGKDYAPGRPWYGL
jgi:hypothetical protein